MCFTLIHRTYVLQESVGQVQADVKVLECVKRVLFLDKLID